MLQRFGKILQGLLNIERCHSALNCNAHHSYSTKPEGYSYEVIKEIADFFSKNSDIKPLVGIVCGSGLSSMATFLENSKTFEYKNIPKFPVSTVPGHAGKMIFGSLSGVPVMAMQGRFHYYEGYDLPTCAMHVRVMKLLGVKYLIATNAAGGINPKFNVGDIMLIKDHVNMIGFSGNSPLRGKNEDRFGPRFPPLTDAYNTGILGIAKKVVKDMGIEKNVHEGVYASLGGPNYETVAELRMLLTCGVDAVGMSTVPEVIVARHCGMNVFAFSLITNKCSTSYEKIEHANHAEVVSVGEAKQAICGQMVCLVVQEIAKEENCKNKK